ncbi:MAG: anaerobic glycerol-3-phosphate dehydrogenase subunit GlpB [Candidatus Jordarchaeales archaeon]
MIETEILVIGGGVAGLLAATKATDEKLEVTVIDKGSGASYQSSGVIDVMGCPLGEATLKPIEGIAQVIECSPSHPYSVISSERNVTNVIKDAIRYLTSMASNRGVEFKGEIERNVVLLNTIGSFKLTCFYQSTMDRGVLHKLEGASLLVTGFKGLVGFNARFCSSSFKHFASKFNIELRKTSSTELSLPSLREFNLTIIELARMMDEDDFRKELAKKLETEIAVNDVSHVALPTLGLKKPYENMRIFEEETGTSVFELVSPPPSVPAQRLMEALEEEAIERGVRIFRGYKAVGFEGEGRSIKSVTLASGEKRFPAKAKAYILATGKFIGGGIVEERDKVKETVFNLPLYDEKGEPLKRQNISRLLAKSPFPREGHPLMGCGVKVNAQMKPVVNDEVAYDNLFAAGSIISGYNYVREKSGMGVAAVTGYIAGMNAATHVEGG